MRIDPRQSFILELWGFKVARGGIRCPLPSELGLNEISKFFRIFTQLNLEAWPESKYNIIGKKLYTDLYFNLLFSICCTIFKIEWTNLFNRKLTGGVQKLWSHKISWFLRSVKKRTMSEQHLITEKLVLNVHSRG